MKTETCQSVAPKAGATSIQLGDRLMKVDEVAFMLGVSSRSVWRLIARKNLPDPVKVGRCVRLPLSDVRAYVDKIKSCRSAN